MSVSPFLILFFVVASFAGTAVIILAIRATQKSQAAQEEMARRNGWTFTHTPAEGSKGSRTVIENPNEGWALTLYSYARDNPGSSGGAVRRWSQFSAPGPATEHGLAVLLPPVPDKTAQMLSGMLDGLLAQKVLDRMSGGLGEDGKSLTGHGSTEDGFLLASPGAETLLDMISSHPDLKAAREGKNVAQHPIVMRGEFGLRLRLLHLLRRPEEIEAFISLGRTLLGSLKQ